VFVVNAVAGLVALAIAHRVVPRSRSDVRRGLDIRGQLLAIVLLASLTYALIEAPRYGWTSPRIVLVLAADVVLAAVFAAVELRVGEPLVDLRVFHDRQFSGAIFITVATNADREAATTSADGGASGAGGSSTFQGPSDCGTGTTCGDDEPAISTPPSNRMRCRRL